MNLTMRSRSLRIASKYSFADTKLSRKSGALSKPVDTSVRVLTFVLLLATGLVTGTCGGGSPSAPPPPTPAPPPPPPPSQPNRPPVVAIPILPVTLVSDQVTTFDAALYFTDLDGDALIYSATTSDPLTVVVRVTGSEVTLTALRDGAVTVTLTAQDPGGLSRSQTFTATVGDGNTLSAPTNLRVTQTGSAFIEWSWDPVEGASGYDVQFSANETFTNEDEIIARTAEEISYRREGLRAETSTYLRVRSVSSTGEERITSNWSTHVTGMTLAPKPEQPAPPAGLRVSDSGEDFIEWSWDPVEGASGYDVQFTANETFTNEDEIIARTAEEISYRREGLRAETSTYLRVRSVSSTGEERITSNWSTHVTGMTLAPKPAQPAPPAGLRVSDSGEDFIEWSWDPVVDASGYHVELSVEEEFVDGSVFVLPADQTSFVVGASGSAILPPDTDTGWLRVRTVAGDNRTGLTLSEWTMPAIGMMRVPEPIDVPFPAPLVHVRSTETAVRFEWDPVVGVSGYQTESSARADFEDSHTGEIDADRTSFSLPPDAYEDTVWFRIRTVFEDANSIVIFGEWSPWVSGTLIAVSGRGFIVPCVAYSDPELWFPRLLPTMHRVRSELNRLEPLPSLKNLKIENHCDYPVWIELIAILGNRDTFGNYEKYGSFTLSGSLSSGDSSLPCNSPNDHYCFFRHLVNDHDYGPYGLVFTRPLADYLGVSRDDLENGGGYPIFGAVPVGEPTGAGLGVDFALTVCEHGNGEDGCGVRDSWLMWARRYGDSDPGTRWVRIGRPDVQPEYARCVQKLDSKVEVVSPGVVYFDVAFANDCNRSVRIVLQWTIYDKDFKDIGYDWLASSYRAGETRYLCGASRPGLCTVGVGANNTQGRVNVRSNWVACYTNTCPRPSRP